MAVTPLRCLIGESEPPEAREAWKVSVGRTSAETYGETLSAIAACKCDEVKSSSGEHALRPTDDLSACDAIFMTGSPLHLDQETPDTRRQVALMRAVLSPGTPAFGSCAGLQVATVAAGGTVCPNARGGEAAFARWILKSEADRTHPLLSGRPGVYDAPAIHMDEVERLPDGATLLAGNRVCEVEAPEIRCDGGIFWGVQYHPELSVAEMAPSVRRQGEALIEEGFATGREARMMDELDHSQERRRSAWHLGVDEQVTVPTERTRELRNVIKHLVRPTKSARGRVRSGDRVSARLDQRARESFDASAWRT